MRGQEVARAKIWRTPVGRWTYDIVAATGWLIRAGGYHHTHRDALKSACADLRKQAES